MKMPVTYITHGGGPWPFMDRSNMGPDEPFQEMEEWLRNLGSTLPEKPRAVLVFSAHREEPVVTLMATPEPPLFYDYYGFPEYTYDLEYPAKGDPALAGRIAEILESQGIVTNLDSQAEYDHGVFVPFILIYPDADIPILQISLRSDLDPTFHLELGKALAPLRNEGIWIVGSGMSYHNLRRFGASATAPSKEFDDWLTSAVLSPPEARENLLRNWSEAPSARICHPREEHLIPLLSIAGSAGENPGRRIFHTILMGAHVSAYEFGDRNT